MEESAKYLRPDILQKLSRMELRARAIVDELLTGMHKSSARGFNIEFLEHREFSPGDDLRHVDWKLYGKTDRFFIKQHEEDTSLRAYILLDSSTSMRFASEQGGESKWDYAAVLAIAVAYLFLKQGDSVGFLTFDTAPRTFVEPRAVREHLFRILSTLTEPPGGETKISATLQRFAPQLKKTSCLVLISDLLDDIGPVMQNIKVLRTGGHDIAIFHILDPAEADFPYSRAARFVDLETGRSLVADPVAVRRLYKKNLEEFLTKYSKFSREIGIDFSSTTTATPVEKILLEFLTRRHTRSPKQRRARA